MKKTLLATVFIAFVHPCSFAQVNKALIELGKTYNQYMFRNEAPAAVLTNLDTYDTTQLSFVADFIKETITTNTKILSDKFLHRPSDADLKLIYIVRQVHLNVGLETPRNNEELVDELLKKEFTVYELVDNYYSLLFAAYGNKVQPYNLSKTNFQLDQYEFKDDTEKGIFFLVSMEFNGLLIWGYMNIVRPPNYAKAYDLIKKYPTYNGSPYYQFSVLNFPDFEMPIEDAKPTSYKTYYINKYYDVLLSHLACLKDKGDEEKMYDLILGSILSKEIYFKYSKREKEIRKLMTVYKK